MRDPFATTGNRLLAAMPDSTLQRWSRYLVEEDVPLGSTVVERGSRLVAVHFPTTAVVSLLHVLDHGEMVEVSMVGREGLVGIDVFLDGLQAGRAVVHGAGRMLRLPAELLLEEFERGGPAMHLLLHYTQARMAQVTQVAACYRYHTIDQQLCRWLLLCLDRVGSNDIVMTQALIARLLGVRREGVTAAAARLQRAGLLRYSRGHITVLDRDGIEGCSCECYATINREYARLLPEPCPA